MKYLSNEDSDMIQDMMYGMRSAYPGLFICPNKNVILLNRDRAHRVALLTGVGAGHEPYGSGFVGENLLTGFVCGPVFDSPSIGSISAAINHLAEWNKGGILLFIANSSCNRLTFGVALERAIAKGINIRSTVIMDDCSLSGANGVHHEILANRRTLSGSAIYFKILGGLSSAGSSLEQLLEEERLIKARTSSASVSYSPPYLPNKTVPQFLLRRGLISLGVGANGEEGGQFTFKSRPIQEIVHILIGRLLPRCLLSSGGTGRGSVVVLVNSLGALTKMENYLIVNCANKDLKSRGIEVCRMYAGVVLTSLNMKGFTLTLTNVTDRQSWLDLLDLETEGWAWPGTLLSRKSVFGGRLEIQRNLKDIQQMCGRELDHHEMTSIKNCILSVCRELIKHKDMLNKLCAGTGVQLGTEMHRFAEATQGKLKESSRFLQSLPNTFLALSSLAEQNMSTSAAGSIYALLLLGAAASSNRPWTEIWEAAVETLSKYTASKLGHRSLLDALIPASQVFMRVQARDGPQAWRSALKAAVETAEENCAETKTMISKFPQGERRNAWRQAVRRENESPNYYSFVSSDHFRSGVIPYQTNQAHNPTFFIFMNLPHFYYMVISTKSPFYRENPSGDMEEAGARTVVIVLRAIFKSLCPDLEQPGVRRQDRRFSSVTYPVSPMH